MTAATDLRPLYPPSQPYDEAWINVSANHRLYFEQWGSANGIPALVLHGGPGSGCTPAMARFFDPQRYRIILLDQRGAGRSEPQGSREENTTTLLLEDIEALRRQLGIERWLLLGGSWGGTLGVLAAAAYPQTVSGLLLRNPFLARQEDLDWFFDGARPLHAERWQRWRALGAPESAGAMLPWLEQRFELATATELKALVLAWSQWENALAQISDAALPSEEALPRLAKKYRLQLHYFCHGCRLESNAVLTAAANLGNLPVHILQGRIDHVCPAPGAEALHRAIGGSSLQWIEGVGHDPYAPTMIDATVTALDQFALSGRFRGE
ncbi:MAG TPA: alpha/beta fold hydrolase [Rhodocyclaceae bacterium]|jgi:proline iminopeptidase